MAALHARILGLEFNLTARRALEACHSRNPKINRKKEYHAITSKLIA